METGGSRLKKNIDGPRCTMCPAGCASGDFMLPQGYPRQRPHGPGHLKIRRSWLRGRFLIKAELFSQWSPAETPGGAAIEMLFRARGPLPGAWEAGNGPMGLFCDYLRLNFFWTVEKVDRRPRGTCAAADGAGACGVIVIGFGVD